MSEYDCTEDVLEHKRKVKYWMDDFARYIGARAITHDNSKLRPPEKDVFDKYTHKLKTTEFGSEEYEAQLAAMQDGVQYHYASNPHHPEHFENGIAGMTLYDLVEMFCDWLAATEAKNEPINIKYLSQRFGINAQLADILINTMRSLDFWNAINGVPVTNFTPDDIDGKSPTILPGGVEIK